jgi:hypothetical protein
MSTAWKNREGGSYYRYRKMRSQILAANEQANAGKCTLAIPDKCTGKATQIHHTQGLTVTGHDLRYMVPACMACNNHIGSPEKFGDPKGIEPNWY